MRDTNRSSAPNAAPPGAADILATGFGTTVAMWGVGYFCRLPVVHAPPPVLLPLLLLCVLAGGWAAGRFGSRGIGGGVYAGLLSGVLNLLVLGGLVSHPDSPNTVLPSAVIWLPGFVAASAAIGGIGAALAGRRSPEAAPIGWTPVMAQVAAAATFLLLIVGGIVTSNAAGLAVVDWPNSYRYNMFLYPFSRMTGGIYYEHAHRLFGSLVGLTTLVLAVHLGGLPLPVPFRARDPRGWVRRLALAAFVLVVLQGVLGGLRVTGRLTLSDDPAHTAPNVYLAVVHGITAQIFFALLVVLAVVVSPAWIAGFSRADRPAAKAVERLGTITIALVLLQILLGALQRHLAAALWLHVVTAFAVAGHAVAFGLRLWGRQAGEPVLRRAGLLVMGTTSFQFLLGLVVFAVREAAGVLPDAVVVALRTLHQGTGALVLGSVVAARLVAGRAAQSPSANLGQPSAS